MSETTGMYVIIDRYSTVDRSVDLKSIKSNNHNRKDIKEYLKR